MYENAPIKIRSDLATAHERAFRRISAAGTWFNGATRVDIAKEVRNAPLCQLCRDRKSALSPFSMDGSHDTIVELKEIVVDVIHRLVTDSGRVTEKWYQQTIENGLSDAEYIEIVGIVASVMAIDTVSYGIGCDPIPLPTPKRGEPNRARPRGVKPGLAWMPTLAPEDAEADEIKIFPGGHKAPNIRRAMSLVPAEVVGFFDLTDHHYLPTANMWDFDKRLRAISNIQIELVAARVSAMNDCFY